MPRCYHYLTIAQTSHAAGFNTELKWAKGVSLPLAMKGMGTWYLAYFSGQTRP